MAGCVYMPRVTLYVPDDLKARMDEVGELVNWSAIAQRAFGEAVASHRLRKDPTDMKEVIERLRASKERIEAQAESYGKECGKKWAMQSAEYDELKRIAEFDDGGHDPNLETLQLLIDPE